MYFWPHQVKSIACDCSIQLGLISTQILNNTKLTLQGIMSMWHVMLNLTKKALHPKVKCHRDWPSDKIGPIFAWRGSNSQVGCLARPSFLGITTTKIWVLACLVLLTQYHLNPCQFIWQDLFRSIFFASFTLFRHGEIFTHKISVLYLYSTGVWFFDELSRENQNDLPTGKHHFFRQDAKM